MYVKIENVQYELYNLYKYKKGDELLNNERLSEVNDRQSVQSKCVNVVSTKCTSLIPTYLQKYNSHLKWC